MSWHNERLHEYSRTKLVGYLRSLLKQKYHVKRKVKQIREELAKRDGRRQESQR